MAHPIRTELAQAVRKEVKAQASPQETRLVQDLGDTPEGLQAWLRELIFAKSEVELQFSQRKADLNAVRSQGLLSNDPTGKERYLQLLRDVSTWKIGASRYLRALEQKISQVKGRITLPQKGREDAR